MLARFEVRGQSMGPLLSDGDRVLVFKTPNIGVGDIIVFSNGERDCIKKVVATDDDWISVEGLNRNCSTDSRHYGPIARARIMGKVLLRY